MKITRRKFIRTTSILGSGILASKFYGKPNPQKIHKAVKQPIALSTWKFSMPAGLKAFEILSKGGSILDAVEKGINVAENDPEIPSIGLGSFPDADGNVTLDACIMDSSGNSGAVAYLQNIKNPISVARLVKEKTPHVLLAGEGAEKFALANGFKKENLLTPKMRKKWLQWKKTNGDMHDPVINHDTIGLLAMDENGNIAGGVSTSGWAYKLPGRVGDSAIIGASLFVDNDVGAACATGLGEMVIQTAGSFLIVEKMREGYSPLEACKIAISRLSKYRTQNKFDVSYLALNKEGEYAAYSTSGLFEYFLVTNGTKSIIKSDFKN